MTVLRAYPVLSRALVLLAILAACLALDALLVLLIAGGLAAASGLIVDGPRGLHLRRASSLMLSGLALVGTSLWALLHPDEAVASISQFAIWLTVIKMYERHTLENEAERLVLSVLLIALGAMRGVDLLFGALLMVWVVLAIVVLLLFQMQVGRGEFIGIDESARTRRSDPVSGHGVRRQFRRTVGLIALAGLAISATLFMTFPRSISPGLSAASGARLTRTGSGIRDEVELVTGTRIVATNGLVAEVEVTGDVSAVTEGTRLYLRTGTSSLYRGHGLWSPRHRGNEQVIWCERDEWTSVRRDVREGPSATVHVTLHRDLEYLPLVRGMQRIRPGRSIQFEWMPTREVARLLDSDPRRFEIESDGQAVPASDGFPYQSLRPIAVQRLAISLLEDAGLPASAPAALVDRPEWRASAVHVFLSHLRSPRFSYSLDLSRVGADPTLRETDPIERFLLHEPVGHCEYFAAGFVALCQSVGIDARIVQGFLAASIGDDRWVALDRDAHAWAEVRIESDRWTRQDPTATRRQSLEDDQVGLWADLTWFARMTDSRWRLYVLGYDGQTQQRMADWVFPGISGAIDATQAGAQRLLERMDLLFGIGRAGTIWLFSVIGLIGVACVVFIRVRRRHRRFMKRIGLEAGGLTRNDIAFYEDFLEVLVRAGLTKPEHCPPLTWCDRIATANEQAGEAARRLVRRFYAVRYGGVPVDSGMVKPELEALARALGVRQ